MKKATERASQPENEEETAQRSSFSRPIPVDHLTSTARIPTAHLETMLRNESGTRPVVSRDEILRSMEEGLDGSWVGDVSIRLDHATSLAEDPHSRPTIDVFPAVSMPAAAPAITDRVTDRVADLVRPVTPAAEQPAPLSGVTRTSPISVAAAPLSVTTPLPMVLTPLPTSAPVPSTNLTHAPLPRWLVPVAIASVLFLVTLTITVGFFLGRITGH